MLLDYFMRRTRRTAAWALRTRAGRAALNRAAYGAAAYARGVLTARAARVYARALLLGYGAAHTGGVRRHLVLRPNAEPAAAYLARRAPFEEPPLKKAPRK